MSILDYQVKSVQILFTREIRVTVLQFLNIADLPDMHHSGGGSFLFFRNAARCTTRSPNFFSRSSRS